MSTRSRPALARSLRLTSDGVRVRLSDGRTITIRFDDFAFLRAASQEDRTNCVIEDGGMALWWPALSEGISVAGLLGVSEADLEALAAGEPRA